MELRDYLRMLRRGWPIVLIVTLIGVALSSAYLAVAPQRFESTAVLFIGPDDARSIGDLQQGSQYAVSAAPTYADVVDSSRVLAPVAGEIGGDVTTETLEKSVSASAREATSLIDVTASAETAAEAADVANAVARSAAVVIPDLTRSGNNNLILLVDVQVVRDAPDPVQAVSPVASRIYSLGVVIGLALGLALAITRQSFDTRVHRAEDLAQVTDLPLLGAVPTPRRRQRNLVVVRDEPMSAAVESFRSLRTNLSYLESAGACSLLFTSASARHDDAKVPTNLAWSMAQSGRRVLLIDLDLRRSPVSLLAGVSSSPGLVNVLAGSASLADVVQRTSQPDLDVLACGRAPATSPSDMLSSPRMAALMRAAERDYDFVVLHAPTLLGYTDAAVAARFTGHTLVTVTAHATDAAQVRTALAALANVQVQPLGVVLVGATASKGQTGNRGGTRRRVVEGPEAPATGTRWAARQQETKPGDEPRTLGLRTSS